MDAELVGVNEVSWVFSSLVPELLVFKRTHETPVPKKPPEALSAAELAEDAKALLWMVFDP